MNTIMSDFVTKVESLKSKIKNLIAVQQNLIVENKNLKLKLSRKEQEVKDLESYTQALSDKCETLKIANSLLGSDTNKRETKLKINYLIKEIDSCISKISN